MPLRVQVTGDLRSGRLLGGQILVNRRAEISKRIDIFATVLFQDAGVEYLNDLDLSYAIAISDFVIIPVRGSNPDAKQAFRHMGLLKTQERLTKRAIPFAMLFTQTSSGASAQDATVHRKATRRRGRARVRGAVGRP